jgi:hypothetical protein
MVPTATKGQNKRGASRRVSQNKSSGQQQQQMSNQVMKCPVYRPVYKFNRVVEGIYDIATTGISPTIGAWEFRLDTLPGYTDFTNLFDMYIIKKVEIDWLPEYTELTDAALVSNAVNVRFNTAIDISDGGSPATVDEVLEYATVQSTGITKPHKRVFTPSFLMGGLVPCNCWLPTTASSERHYSVKYGIPPTGVAMVFRSRCRLYVECANVN